MKGYYTMNILLTSAGRRGYLVEFFKQELAGKGEVHVGNSTPFASAFYYADKSVVTPLIYDKEYIPFLIEYCKKNGITAIISLFDVDLYILSINKEKFKKVGIEVIVSSPKTIEICNDKWATFQFCKENGFHVPKTYCRLNDVRQAIENLEVRYPIIIKPRWGMGSIAVYQAENEEELEVLARKVKNEIFNSYLKYESGFNEEECVLFQEKLLGQEYGIDVIHDLRGTYCQTVVRKKLAMRAGETDCAQVLRNSQIEVLGEEIGKKLGHIGNLDMDIFEIEDKIYILEMNARFGGGYPFSHLAGVNLPRAIIKWLEGDKITDELQIIKEGLIAQKDITLIDITKCMEE